MLHVARECGPPRAPSASGPAASPSSPASHTLLTFGEFCLFSTDLKREYHKISPRPVHLTRQISANNHTQKFSPSKINNSRESKCEVFLGGSCNPTTWRQDTAIPILKDLGISYYNPQVTHWEEALVEREHIAKNTASVLFFVFDRSTRNVASMVEVSYIAAQKRKIMLVLDSYPGPQHQIGGETMTQREYEELSGGLNTVQDLVERRGIPVFSQIPHALHCTAKIIQEDLWPQQLGTTEEVTPICNPHLQPSEKYTQILEAFRGNRALSLEECQPIFGDIVGRPMTHEELITVVAAKRGMSAGSVSVSSELPLKEALVTVDEFCCIVAEFSSPKVEKRKLRNFFNNSVVSDLQKAFGIESPRRSPRFLRSSTVAGDCTSPKSSFGDLHTPTKPTSYNYDVYLGGDRDISQSWQDKIAIPLLESHGMTYCIAGASTPKSPLSPVQKGPFMQKNNVLNHRSTSHLSSSTKLTNGVSSPLRKPHHVEEEAESQATSKSNNSLQVPQICLPSSGEDYDSDTRGRLYPSEAANIDQCRVLLFVVSANSRGVSTMNLASHYIGLGCNVVLCVQKIPDNAVVKGDLLTKAATKDYNRGRSYLTDLAEKHNVPVFSDVKESVVCAIQKSELCR